MAGKTRASQNHIEEDPEVEIADKARRLVKKALRRGYTIETLKNIFTNSNSLAGGVLAAVRRANGAPAPTACREGCNYCCHLQVEISVPELVTLVAYIVENFSKEEIEALKGRVYEAERQTRGLNSYERLFARVLCPLLSDGRCSVYPARPLVCRGYNSHNWAICAQDLNYPRSWRLIPHDNAQKNIYSDVLDGLSTGLKEEGLSSELLELIAALRIALEQPDAGERWLAGEPVFQPAIAPDE